MSEKVYRSTLADSTLQIDKQNNNEKYRVDIKAYSKHLEDWEKIPMIAEHITSSQDLSEFNVEVGEKIGEVRKCFMNTEGFYTTDDEKDINRSFVEANYKPAIEFTLNEKGDKIAQYRQGVSNTFEVIESHYVDEAGEKDILVADKIKPISVAVLFKSKPNYVACSIKENSAIEEKEGDKNNLLTLSNKNINNTIDFNMEEDKKEQTGEKNNEKCNSGVVDLSAILSKIDNLEAKIDKLLSQKVSTEEVVKENSEDENNKDDKKEDKKENSEEEEKKKEEEDKKDDKEKIKENSLIEDNNIKTTQVLNEVDVSEQYRRIFNVN